MNQENKTGEPRKRRMWPWILGVGTAIVILGSVGACALFGITANLALGGGQSSWRFGDAVGVIYIEGPIGISSASRVFSHSCPFLG